MIQQGMGDVSGRLRQGQVGRFAMGSGHNRSFCGANSTPQRVQVATIVVDTEASNTDYTFSVNGVELTVTSDASGTKAEIAALIVAAIEADPVANARNATVVSDGTDTVTITGLYPNDSYDVSDNDGNLTSTVTVAADAADPIPFGRAVISQGFVSGEIERIVSLPVSTMFAAQVVTLTPTYVASSKIRVRVYEVWGGERQLLADVTETSASDLATTLTALAASLNAKLAANTVLVAVNGGNTALTFTAERLGMEIDVESGVGDEGASLPANAVTYTTGPSVSTSLHRAWAGVSLYDASVMQPVSGGAAEGEYDANADVKYAQEGPIWVKSDEAVTAQGEVYVETAAGATCGRFYTSGTSTRVKLAKGRARWDRDGLQSSESLAVLRLLSY